MAKGGENIRVIVRFRPINAREEQEQTAAKAEIDFKDDEQNLEIRVPTSSHGDQKFSFDYVMKPSILQKDFYDKACKHVVDEVLQGYNGTIFAYGQTGSGKSWSMMGDVTNRDNWGLIPRGTRAIFELINNADANLEFKVSCSYLQIYNEQIMDLFDAAKKNLKIHESPDKGIFVADLTQQYVSCEQDILDLIELGNSNRVVSFTKMNAVSSRSHSVFAIYLHQTNLDSGTIKSSQLNLVDLAGSEKVGKTGATGQTLEEAKKINQSLSCLGNCINALVEAKNHIPFRDSKLTRILQQSLGGNCKTTLVCAASPHPFNIEETISTLRFGQRAKSIKCAVKINAIRSAKELQRIVDQLTAQIKVLQEQNSDLLKQLQAAGITVDMSKYQDRQELPPEVEAVAEAQSPSSPVLANADESAAALSKAEIMIEMENLKVKHNNEMQALMDEMTEILSRNEALKEKNEALRKTSEEAQDAVEELLLEVEKTEQSKADLQNKLTYQKQELENELNQTLEHVEELEKGRDELEAELRKARKQLALAADATASKPQQIEPSIVPATPSSPSPSNVVSSPVRQVIQEPENPSEKAKLLVEVDRLQASEKALQERLLASDERLHATEQILEKKTSEVIEIQLKYSRIVSDMSSQRERLQSEMEKMVQLVEKAEKQRDEKEDQLSQLEAELSKLLSEADLNEKTCQTMRSQVKQLQQRSDQKEQAIMRLKLLLQKAELQGKPTADEELETFFVAEFGNAIQELRENQEITERQKDAEVKMLVDQLEEERATVVLLEKECVTQLDQAQDSVEIEQTRLKSAEKELAEAKEKEAKLEQELLLAKASFEQESAKLNALLRDEREATKTALNRLKQLEQDLENAIKERETMRLNVAQVSSAASAAAAAVAEASPTPTVPASPVTPSTPVSTPQKTQPAASPVAAASPAVSATQAAAAAAPTKQAPTPTIANMANELLDLRTQHRKAEALRTKLEDECNHSRRVIQSERAKLKAAQSKCDLQKTRIQELETEIEFLRVNTTQKRDEREDFKKQRQELLAKIAELEGTIEQLQKSVMLRQKDKPRVFVPLGGGRSGTVFRAPSQESLADMSSSQLSSSMSQESALVTTQQQIAQLRRGSLLRMQPPPVFYSEFKAAGPISPSNSAAASSDGNKFGQHLLRKTGNRSVE